MMDAAQARVDTSVLAAELFEPNASKFGIGTMLGIFWLLSERRAIRKGGMARQTLWAVTSEELYIFEAKYRIFLRRLEAKKLFGRWSIKSLGAYQVPEKGPFPANPSFVVAFDYGGHHYEAGACSHSDFARYIIDTLVAQGQGAKVTENLMSDERSASPRIMFGALPPALLLTMPLMFLRASSTGPRSLATSLRIMLPLLAGIRLWLGFLQAYQAWRNRIPLRDIVKPGGRALRSASAEFVFVSGICVALLVNSYPAAIVAVALNLLVVLINKVYKSDSVS